MTEKLVFDERKAVELEEGLDRILMRWPEVPVTREFLYELRAYIQMLSLLRPSQSWDGTGKLHGKSRVGFERLVSALMSDNGIGKTEAVAKAAELQGHEPDWGWKLLNRHKRKLRS